MSEENFSGSAQITNEGIKKHFKNYEPVDALYELVWNSLDAKASTVEINIIHNDLDGLDQILVVDNGEGIDVKDQDNNFGKFNESSKKHDDDKHGSHGRGRLAFHRLCDDAIWFTSREGYHAKIEINSGSIKDYNGFYIEETDQHQALKSFESGTCVELINFAGKNLPKLGKILENFSREFGWYLALNENVRISINNKEVLIPPHELFEKSFNIEDHKFSAKVIRWEDRPSSEKSYNYLINGRGRVVQKELSKFNNKITFHTSAYVASDWIDQYDPDTLELSAEHQQNSYIYREIMKELLSFQREIYKAFLIKFVDEEIQKYDENGYFPSYSGLDANYAEWRKSNTKSVLKNIYVADPTIFNKIKEKQAKVLVRLLDVLLVSNENDALFDVLDGVLDLNSESIAALAEQMSRTTLENIISTIEVLQKRQLSVHKLREIIGVRYKEVLETPDLQKIIENNTWLFGPQYTTLGAEEDTFTRIARNLREQVKGIHDVESGDIFEDVEIKGANKQVDLFLARKIPTFDADGKEIFKCVIIEIKRPSVSLNKKHLQQLDDYAEILAKHPDFSSDKLRFELILVGRKISKEDIQIRQRLKSLKEKAEYGLVTDTDNMKCYVKDWFTIFDEFELSNNYLLGNLQTKLEDLTADPTVSMVKELQKEIA